MRQKTLYQKMYAALLSVGFICLFALGILFVDRVSGQTNKQKAKGSKSTPPAPATPNSTPAKKTDKKIEKLVERSATLSGRIPFDSLTAGSIDWDRPGTGAISQNSNSFALYNEFQLETKSPELFTIQLQTSKPSANWQVWVFDNAQQYRQQKLISAHNDGIYDAVTWMNIPAGGNYMIQVRYAGVAATNSKIVEPYNLLISSIRTITLEGGRSDEILSRTSRKIQGPAGKITYVKEYLFDAIGKGGFYSVELMPAQLKFKVFSEDNGRLLDNTPGAEEHGDVGDLLLMDGGKYRLQILYPTESKQKVEVPYFIKFHPKTMPLENYRKEVRRLLGDFKGIRECKDIARKLEYLTLLNQREPEAYMALGKIRFLCAEYDRAYKEIEKGFSLGGTLSFDVLHRSDCEKELKNSNVHAEVKGKSPSQLNFQNGKIEIQTCRKLTGQRASIDLLDGDLVIKIDLVDGPKKSFYFAASNLEQQQARMIRDMLNYFLSKAK